MKIDLFYDSKENSTKFKLIEDLEVQGFTIPSGFISDGGSIPRMLWSWASPLDGRFLAVYCCHDYLYTTGILSREDADKLLKKGLVEAGMGETKARTIYTAVKMFRGLALSQRLNYILIRHIP